MGVQHRPRRASLLATIALFLLAFPFIASITSCSEYREEQLANESDKTQIEREEKEGNRNSEDGLLELEIIGYTNAVSNFIEVDTEGVREKIANGDCFYLYTGRLTCQWCRRLAPSLYDVSREKDIDIYYLDSSNTETDNDLASFRDEYAIETVPSVIFFDSERSATELNIDVNAENMRLEIEKALTQRS